MTPRRSRCAVVACTLVASLTALAPGPASAQDAEEFPVPASTRLWLAFGYGRATPYKYGVLFGLSGSRSGHVVGARAAMSTAGFLDDGALDIGILYGRRWERPGGFLALSGGPAYVEAIDGGGVFASSEISNTVGAAFAGEGVLTFGGFFGVGGYAFLNLNSLDNFAGLLVTVYLGKVK
jgi:hypothetical protein